MGEKKILSYIMVISRSSIHKRHPNSKKRKSHWRKSRKYELARPASNTKLDRNSCVKLLRVRGGNIKFRALRLNSGNLSWRSEAVTRKTRIFEVTKDSLNRRSKILVKGTIIKVDAKPFKLWYSSHYGTDLSTTNDKKTRIIVKRSAHLEQKIESRKMSHPLDSNLKTQFAKGKLYARITSRPGQSGRADGYILEGKELDDYFRKSKKK